MPISLVHAKNQSWTLAKKSRGLEIWKTKANPRTYCSVLTKTRPLRYLYSPGYLGRQVVAAEAEKNKLLGLFNISNRVIKKQNILNGRQGREIFLSGTYVDGYQDSMNFVEVHRNRNGQGELTLCSSERRVDDQTYRDFSLYRESK